MNEVFRRRLIGLAVLLALAFLLSLLLPGAPAREELEPSTTVSLSGEILQVTEADAVPPPDDYTSPDVAAAAKDGSKPAGPEVAISDLSDPRRDEDREPEPPPAAPKPAVDKTPAVKAPVAKPVTPAAPPPAPGTSLKLAPKVTKPEPDPKQAAAEPSPRPPAQVVTPKPRLAESVAKPPSAADDKAAGGNWFVQIGSFSELGTATTIASLIRKLGYRGEVSKISGKNGRTLHRVRAGPYPTEAAARSAQARIATQGYPQARVMSEASR